MKKGIFIVLLGLLCLSVDAQSLWMRYNSISPNGKNIAFTYKGDIYVVSSSGGQALQLTTNPAYDYAPIWSSDNSKIAFASDRNGNFDVYCVPVTGGTAKRITTNSSKEIPIVFSPDSQKIYYSAEIQDPASNVQFPFNNISELYKVSVEGGRPELVVSSPVSGISFDEDGESFLYYCSNSNENTWRKHHTSSAATDIFYYNAKDKTHKQLTTNEGEDRNPNFLPGFRKLVYLSERDGKTFNIYEASIDSPNDARQWTFFEKHPVRFLTVSKGSTHCFNYHGEIYIQKPGMEPTKVDVKIINDQETEQVEQINLNGGEGFAMTEDGKQIVFVARGNVFATTDEFATTKQISNTPEAEKELNFSPDGKTVAYASERGGTWNIYLAKKLREDEINFANSTLIEEKPLFENSEIERFCPKFSPDGKEIAFIEDRNILKVINLETKEIRQITDGTQHYNNKDFGFNYSWSPDGKWFALDLITNVHFPYSDIGIISSKGGDKIHNITNSGYIDGFPVWVLDGNAILFNSNRLGMRSHASWGSQNDVFIAFLNQDAYDKFRLTKEEYQLLKEEEKSNKTIDKEEDTKSKTKKEEVKDIEVEFDRLDERCVRLTPMSSMLSSYMLSKDGEKLFFLSAFEGGFDLWETNLRSKTTKLLKKMDGAPGELKLSKDGETLYVFSRKEVQKMPVKGGELKKIAIKATMELNRTKEREYMYDHVFTQEKKRFYNTDYHGVDLDSLKIAYQPFLAHINNNYDFAEMFSEILGELNVSHTGSGYVSAANGDETAQMGVFFDWDYDGDGLKIDEIVEYGPFDTKDSKVKEGNIIEKIDGVDILAGMDYFMLLNKKAGKRLLVSVYDPQTNERWDEVVKPISKRNLRELLYKRWVKHNADDVDRLSDGRLGYVHIRSMGDASYRDVYSDILGKYNLREGIVIDTRFNGGGRLHEDIEVLFSGEKYFEQVIRDVVVCDMPSRRYNKPSIMIVGESNYSNAHGTTWVYKYKKMGKIVGMPVPGTMTMVSWETMQDPTLYFGIPVAGYRLKDGTYLENSQLEPDIKVRNTPEKLLEGVDEQLEAAVKELLKEVDAFEKW